MAKSTDSEERLAELIWRTVKLRVSLLVLTNLVLLVVWSSMANGKKQAQAVDLDFCKQLIADQNKATPLLQVSAATWCTPEGARNMVEGVRMANGILLMGWQALSENEATKEGAKKILQQYGETKHILDEYDTKRRDAFPLQVQLSSEYSGGNIVLNGQFAAKLLPFCVLFVFSIVVVLGLQQAAYSQQLISLLPKASANNSDRALRLARGQLFAAFIPGTDSRFSNWTVLSPATLAIGSLYVLFVVSFFSVVLSVISDLVHLTDSVLFSYPSALLAVAFVLALLLARTRQRYEELYPRPHLARERKTRWAFVTLHWREAALSVVGLLSLALPWTRGFASLRGYNFIIKQHGAAQPGGVVSFPVDPTIFLEVRFQVVFAVIFLLFSGAHAVTSIRQNRAGTGVLAKVQYFMAIAVLFFSIDYLIYMGILQYGVDFADNPMLSIFAFLTTNTHEYGNPMNAYDPAYGFVIFLLSCFGLIWLSIRDRHLVHGSPGSDAAALFDSVGPCLDELETEYLRIGIESCKGLEDHSQLSAFLMLGIRSVCLLRGMLRLGDPQFLDTYDSARRSFIESWQLQFEFKLRDSATKAQKWLEGVPDSWKPEIGKLEALVKKLQGGQAGFGREWGGLSELAHPSVQAAINSVSIASTIAGVNPRPHALGDEFQKLMGDFVGLLNREIWLTIQNCPDFIDTPLEPARFTKCLKLHEQFLQVAAKDVSSETNSRASSN
jgi:hypothetical protein